MERPTPSSGLTRAGIMMMMLKERLYATTAGDEVDIEACMKH